jgi:hypothetical protein
MPLLINYQEVQYRLNASEMTGSGGIPAFLGIRRLHCSGYLHRADALTSWRVLFFIDFSAPPPWHTVCSELVESIRARIALADLQLTFFGDNRSVILVQFPSDRINYAIH